MDNGDKPNHGLTATHLYGTGGFIVGVTGIVASMREVSDYKEWLLLGSGWIVSVFLSWYLLRISGRLTKIIENHDKEVATAVRKVTELEEQNKQYIATMSLLTSLIGPRQATPRKQRQTAAEDKGEEK